MPNPRRFIVMALVLVALAAASFDYTVKSGDTLGEIAITNGVSTKALADANGITNPDLIRPGQVLVIPGVASASGGSGSSGGTTSSSTYTVKSGDSLYKIASAHQVSLSSIIEANNITNANLIRPGQELVIPGGTASGSSSGSGSSSSGSTPTVVAGSTTYVVQSGDTLGKIAAKFGISSSALASANGITNPNLIWPGQKLAVDGGSSPTTSGPSVSDEVWIADGAGIPAIETYTVVSGDTLAKIGSKYGVGISAIVDANSLANANVLSIGQHLVIPLGDGWACPLPGSSFVDTWGAPRPGGRLHEGTDIFAPRGTPFLAPVSGVVTTRTGSIAGLQVELLGDDGVWYFGTHMDAFGKTGRVNKGDVIGYVGNTGNAITTPPHVHMEIHPHGRGTPVNPYYTLRKACS